MGVWGATPEPKQHFLALCNSNTPVPGIQKHFYWPVVCRGMCTERHPRNPQMCLHRASQTHPSSTRRLRASFLHLCCGILQYLNKRGVKGLRTQSLSSVPCIFSAPGGKVPQTPGAEGCGMGIIRKQHTNQWAITTSRLPNSPATHPLD